MIDQESKQAIVDSEQLRLLSVAYIISGVITALFSVIGLLYAAIGLFISTIVPTTADSNTPTESLPPEFMGIFFAIFGGGLFLVLVSLAIAKFIAASCLKKRKSRTFCMVVGGISCLGIPYGTCLGIFTFMVLGRQSVSELFNPRNVA